MSKNIAQYRKLWDLRVGVSSLTPDSTGLVVTTPNEPLAVKNDLVIDWVFRS